MKIILRDPVDGKYTKMTQVNDRTFKFDASLRYGVLIPANPAMKNAPNPPFQISPELRSAKWFMYSFVWALHWGKEIESPLLHKKPEFELNFDIAICKVEESMGRSYQPLNIGLHNLKLGDRAVAIGYAEMKNIRFKDGDDYQPELIVSVGSVINIHPDNMTEKKNSTPGPNFEFDAKIPGKMSGSPILVGGGILTKGVVSRSWQGENHASGCLVAPMTNLPLLNGKSLHDMMKAGEEGIAQINGPNL